MLWGQVLQGPRDGCQIMKRHVVHTNESLFPLMEGKSVPYQPQSPTSKAAAKLVQPRAGSQRDMVLQHILTRGSYGVADHEGIRDLAEQIPSIGNAYRARRVELAKDGLIKKRAKGRVNPVSNATFGWVPSCWT